MLTGVRFYCQEGNEAHWEMTRREGSRERAYRYRAVVTKVWLVISTCERLPLSALPVAWRRVAFAHVRQSYGLLGGMNAVDGYLDNCQFFYRACFGCQITNILCTL